MEEPELALLLRQDGGVLVRRQHLDLSSRLDWWLRVGQLVDVLPGVYTAPELAPDPRVRMQAVCRAHPDAVLTGAAAARLSYWPAAPLGAVEAAVPRRRWGDRASCSAAVGCRPSWWRRGAGSGGRSRA